MIGPAAPSPLELLQKLWWQHIWVSLQPDLRTQDSLAAVLQPILVLIQESTLEEYEEIILPVFRGLFAAPKTVQATVTILENLHVILQKTNREEIRTDILNFLFNSFESTTIQVQVINRLGIVRKSQGIGFSPPLPLL